MANVIVEPMTKGRQGRQVFRLVNFRNREVWKEQAKREGYHVEAIDDVGEGYWIAYNETHDPVGAMPWSPGCSDRTPINKGWLTVEV